MTNENEAKSESKKSCKNKCGGTKKTLLGVGIIGALAFAVCCLVSGCNHHASAEKKAEWITKKISSKLDLNEEQESKLEEVKIAFLQSRKKHKEGRKEMLSEIEGLISSDSVAITDIKKLIDRKKSWIDGELPRVFPKIKAFHASLSFEQKKNAVELIRKFKKRHCGGD